jgi:hypothetical protein
MQEVWGSKEKKMFSGGRLWRFSEKKCEKIEGMKHGNDEK